MASILNAIGTGWDYLTPGKGSSRLTTAGQQPTSYGGFDKPWPGGTITEESAPSVQSVSTTTAVPADPNAAKRTNFLNMVGDAVNNIGMNATDAWGSGSRKLQGTAEGFFNTVSQGQRAVDSARENVELNRLNSVKDILGFVRNGLESGGRRLANMNALEGSGAEALARAYGEVGTNRMRTVGNQAALQNRDLDVEQGEVDLQRAQGQRDFARDRDEIVSNVGTQVRNELAKLDAQGRELGVTGKVQIEAEKQRIINEGLAKLREVDTWMANNMNTISPRDAAAVRQNAVALQQAGTGDITPMEFGEAGGSLPMTGPALTQLPLFTRSRKER